MRMVDIIEKKRDAKELTTAEISFFITEYNQGNIPDYQASALLMAIYLNSMKPRETADLAVAMANSGDKITYPGIQGKKVDKHSSGGVGDKTTLLLLPMVAACGLTVPKLSGRGLGFSGGTIDKLESFAGFRTALTQQEFTNLVNKNRLAIMGQTQNIAPVDKKIYALRDVTGTVENLSLIASSIMSKKLATATDAIVLDVKVGRGAFMKTLPQAVELAQSMCRIGASAGQNTVALVTDMNQPLGYAVGNALEVKEVIAALQGQCPPDLLELCLQLGAHMLVLGDIAKDLLAARGMLQQALDSGAAYDTFVTFITAQGGSRQQIENTELLPKADFESKIYAKESGYLENLQADTIGHASLAVGAGRNTKEDTPDLSAGIVCHKKVGDSVAKGDLLATIYASAEEKCEQGATLVESAFEIGREEKTYPLVYATVTGEGVRYAKT